MYIMLSSCCCFFFVVDQDSKRCFRFTPGFYLRKYCTCSLTLHFSYGQIYCLCLHQDELLLLGFKECHKVLMECNNQPFHREATDYYMCKHILHVRPYKVSQQPVSIHLPISRLLAGRRTLYNIWDALWVIGVFFCQLWTYLSVHCHPQACM